MKVAWDDETLPHEARVALGDLIHKRSWAYFVNFTTRVPLGERRAKFVLRDAMSALAREHEDRHFEVAWTIERQLDAAGFHFHFLVQDVIGTLTERLIQNAIKAVCRVADEFLIDRYDPQRGAAWYISKTNRVMIDTACPRTGPCKGGPCVLGRPWRV